ncbi:hypothetical protein SODG_003976 [Sodalis praecaptivus]
MNFIQPGLGAELNPTLLAQAIEQPLQRILEQVDAVLTQGGATRPDVVYLTGGSARSPAAMISAPSPPGWRVGRSVSSAPDAPCVLRRRCLRRRRR